MRKQTKHKDGRGFTTVREQRFKLQFQPQTMAVLCIKLLRSLDGSLSNDLATVNKEIQFGRSDLLVIKHPETLAADLNHAIANELKILNVLAHIHTLAMLRRNSISRPLSVLDFEVRQRNIQCIHALAPYCKDLRSICLCYHDSADSVLSDSITSYASDLSLMSRIEDRALWWQGFDRSDARAQFTGSQSYDSSIKILPSHQLLASEANQSHRYSALTNSSNIVSDSRTFGDRAVDNQNDGAAQQAEDDQAIASGPCNKFTVFPKLPPELRDRIWKLALPGSNQVVFEFKYQDSFTNKKTCEKVSHNTYRTITKVTFKPTFDNTRDDGEFQGLLRACKESRSVVVKRFPIRLRSSDPNQESRLGPEDSFWVQTDCLGDFDRVRGSKFKLPSALKQIKNLGFFLWMLWPVLFAEGRRITISRFHHRQYDEQDEDLSFREVEENALFFAVEHARGFRENLISAMQKWKELENNPDLKMPEVKIMAKGWSSR
ncbi:hypothetical protein N431DRAFT_453034 [Stipitochalara longipes BDJ]|nr:hypothetical protein N431DRAFT_453034 [Stipitochalara longipes BDJ]